MNNSLDKLQLQLLNKQSQKWGLWILFICSFADASFFPAPVLTLFILLVIVNYQKADNYVILATLGTLSGAIAGYFLGYIASVNLNIGSVGFLQYLNNHVPGFSQKGFHNIQLLYSKWNLWILFMASFSPIPYGLFSVSSGIFKINLTVFCFATLICQASKFWLLAFVTKRMGPRVKELFGWKSLPWVILLLLISVVCYYFL
jgi:membrane protein YqaA with SNARE-associated domain